MKLKNFLIYSAFGFGLFLVSLYCLFLFLLPAVVNSDKFVGKCEMLLSEKLGNPVNIENFNFVANPNLSVQIFVKNINAKNLDNKNLASISDVKFSTKPFSVIPKSLNVDKIYLDVFSLKNNLKLSENKNPKFSFNPKYLPLVNVNEISVLLDENSNFRISKIKTEKLKGKNNLSFQGVFNTSFATSPIIFNSNNNIIYSKNIEFDNFKINFKNSKLLLSGDLDNLIIKGRNLPVGELDNAFLYFYRLKNPNQKNFIENFKNLTGFLDVDLVLKNKGLYGHCDLKKINSLFSKFEIPINLPFMVVNFNGKSISTKTEGIFGSDKVFTDFNLSGLFTKSVVVEGNVYSKLTNNTTQKYFPVAKIDGSADAYVNYKTKNKKVSVKYVLTLKKGNNILSKYGNIDCVDKNRQIVVNTFKDGDKMYLKDYRYQFLEGKTPKILFSGSGLIEKVNGRYKPSYASLKTEDNVPITIIKSFTRDLLQTGTFSSDIKYDFKSSKFAGKINLYDVSHSDFLFLENAKLDIKGNKISLITKGTFFDSPIKMNVYVENDFSKNILIHNIDINLDKFIVKRGEDYSSISSSLPIKSASSGDNSTKKIKNSDIIVEQGRIYVGEILHNKFYLHDVEILGKLKNQIVDFVIPQTEYAKGILSATGIYNLENHSSDIHFVASDIDSDEVVTKIFKLPNQVQGLASATLHLITANKLNDINAQATFAIDGGYLPQLGSKEFMLKKSKKMNKFKFINFEKLKFTLSKITNIDFSDKQTFTSSIRGSFLLHNDHVKDIEIYTQSDYFSSFIEGYYNIDSQFTSLYVWGRHNKTKEKTIRILRLPFTFLYRLIFKVERSKDFYQDKLSKIPPIKLRKGDLESVFRVFVTGNINSDNLKVKLKDLQ